MKYWHDKYPTRFGIIFLLVYGILDVADARWFIPKRYKNDQTEWVILKEPAHDDIQGHGSGVDYRRPPNPMLFRKPIRTP